MQQQNYNPCYLKLRQSYFAAVFADNKQKVKVSCVYSAPNDLLLHVANTNVQFPSYFQKIEFPGCITLKRLRNKQKKQKKICRLFKVLHTFSQDSVQTSQPRTNFRSSRPHRCFVKKKKTIVLRFPTVGNKGHVFLKLITKIKLSAHNI